MCGIHGLYQLDGAPVAPRTLSAMGARQQHRGPDDEGWTIDGDCGIAMRRLSIIDLAGGHQPISSADESLWVVCNGEIYNFRELRAELRARGFTFKTGSDSEVLLHLYRAEGDAFVHRLNGMFAFALWDTRRRRLLIGRDRLGVKPLYVLHEPGRRLAFASEAKALLALPGVSAQLDEQAVAGYLGLGYVAGPASIFKGLRKLPPATLLAVEDGGVSEWRYWHMPAAVEEGVSEREWAQRVREQIERSVAMQMVSDVPIGAFLSGGVDSSAVVGLMARHAGGQPVRTYAIGFQGGKAEALYNELPYARSIAERFGTRHREIMVTPDAVSLLPQLLWHLDEPLCDTAFVTTYLVSKFAREDVKVILSGVGGDELFGGYRRYLGEHYGDRFRRLPGWMQRSARAVGRHLPADRHSGLLNTLRLAKGFLATAAMPADERYRSYLQIMDRGAAAAMLLNPGSAPDPLEAAFDGAGTQDGLNRMFAVDAQTQLPDDLLMLTDKMSMAVSLECRVPLLDHQLVELAAAIPASAKVRGGRLKHVMKLALEPLLPAETLDRPKRGFGTPMGGWLKRELAPLLKRLLAPEVVRARGLFHHPTVHRLIVDHEATRTDATDALLALMNLEIWSRMYLDGREPADVSAELRSYLA